MKEKETNDLAFELIDMMGWALQQLHGGTIPEEWKERIKQSCGMKKRGTPTQPGIQAANKEIAVKALNYKTLSMALGDHGTSLEKDYADLIKEISLEYKRDESEVYKTAKINQRKVMPEVLQMMRGRMQWMKKGYEVNGENVPAHLQEMIAAIGEEKAIELKVSEWVQAGKNLEILRSETDNPALYAHSKKMESPHLNTCGGHHSFQRTPETE